MLNGGLSGFGLPVSQVAALGGFNDHVNRLFRSQPVFGFGAAAFRSINSSVTHPMGAPTKLLKQMLLPSAINSFPLALGPKTFPELKYPGLVTLPKLFTQQQSPTLLNHQARLLSAPCQSRESARVTTTPRAQNTHQENAVEDTIMFSFDVLFACDGLDDTFDLVEGATVEREIQISRLSVLISISGDRKGDGVARGCLHLVSNDEKSHLADSDEQV